jgi:hypothetical protein
LTVLEKRGNPALSNGSALRFTRRAHDDVYGLKLGATLNHGKSSATPKAVPARDCRVTIKIHSHSAR